MKKMKLYGFASALMLASAAGMTSCSSDSDITGGSTSTDEIKTEFAINIPRAATTRATSDQVQGEGNNFLGMKNIWLLAFNSNNEPGSSTTWSKALQLNEITKDEVSASTSSKLYKNIPVSTGTKYFMLYGFAPTENNVGCFNEELDLEGGNRTAPDYIYFSLKPILDNNFNLNEGAPYNIIKALNEIDKLTWPEEEPFTSMKSNVESLKAGSSRSVCALFQEIYDYIIKPYGDSQSSFVASVKKAIEDNGFTISTEGKVSTSLNFPGNWGLPDGAFSITYKNGEFAYEEWASNLTGLMKINPTSITYPARLSYYVNTPIHTNNKEIVAGSWPTTTANWTDDTFSQAGWTINGTVNETTVAIALAKNINYGVANLKTSVKCAHKELSDNGDGTVKVTVPDEGLKVTGFLVGNQPDEVDYLFNPVASGKVDHFTQTIWDDQVPVGMTAKTSDPTTFNYTTVLPNKVDGEEQNEVNIAIEFENNTNQPFKGVDGIVEAGARFYLLGTLKPNKAVDGSTTNVPSGEHPSVFMQDYQTTANFTISSLKQAYNTIPDIRTTNMQLGLSVDLKWEKGYNYDIIIGGDN